MRDLIDQIKKAIVFIGRINEKDEPDFYATGFLVRAREIIHLLTAKHVIKHPITGKFIDKEMVAFFNMKDGKIGFRSIEELKNNYEISWIFHENYDVDIALIPFPVNPEREDVRTIPEHFFLKPDKLFEIYDVFFLSYQPGIHPQKKILPIIRSGTISLINDDKTFFIDASAFPGNSGSPVFLTPSPIRYTESGISIGGDELGGKFIGILGSYIPYQEMAISTQTGRPRVIFEENNGLSKVWSVDFIKETFESDICNQQLDKLAKKLTYTE